MNKTRILCALCILTSIHVFAQSNKLHLLKAENSNAAEQIPPQPRFFALDYTVCVGEPVQFIDSSYGSPTSWNWDFYDGGSPATSTLQNPVVVYTYAGKKDVALRVANTDGQLTKGQVNFITVLVCANLSPGDELNDLSIFPNPAVSYVDLAGQTELIYEFRNTMGQLLDYGITENEPRRIDLNACSPGVYYLTVRKGTQSKTVKVFKE